MSERKEMFAKLSQTENQRELEEALNLINKKKKKKEALSKILGLVKMGLLGIKKVICFACGAVVFVFKQTSSFMKAVDISIELKLERVAPAYGKKLKKIMYGSVAGTAAAASILGFMIGLNLKNDDILIEANQGKGSSIVQASEMNVEDAEKINSGEELINSETINSSKARTSDEQTSSDNVKSYVTDEGIEVYLIGKISSQFELGEEHKDNPGAVVTSSATGEIKYGQLSSDKSREDYVMNFFKYLKEEHSDIFAKFSGVRGVESELLKSTWTKMVEENKNFNNIQVKYKWDNFVKPVIESTKSEFKIDLNKSLLLQELVYSTVSQYGSSKATEIIKNANLKESMSEIEILNAIQDEKANSLGVYTYTDAESYNDSYREKIKARINSEKLELTKLAGQEAYIIK